MDKRKPTTSDCVGCRDDFYNQGNGLNGVCWHLEKAKIVKLRLVPLDMHPPFERVKPVEKPSCYRQHRYVSMKVKADGA